MPKMKTNRTAYKKFRVTKKGKIKRSQAYMSHNTAKKSPKRVRNLRKMTYVDPVDVPMIKAMLPNN
jgi:large subunit ribosomal protein L35